MYVILPAPTVQIRSHPATNSEIRLLCKDLQVLGRSEFKQLLKWRLTLKKDLEKYLTGEESESESGDEEESGGGLKDCIACGAVGSAQYMVLSATHNTTHGSVVQCSAVNLRCAFYPRSS